MNKLRPLFEDQVFFNTVLIENLTDGELGTGFLVRKQLDEKTGRILLFSNKHVFWGKKDKDNPKAKKTLQITFHKKEKDGSHNLGTTLKVKIELERVSEAYKEHAETSIDVACINISEVYNNHPIANLTINVEDFANFDMDSLIVGQKVIFVGYPQGFFDTKNFLPVARFGTIASIPSMDFNGEKQILLDAQVFPGSSGSPVFFLSDKNEYKLLGIISSAPISAQDYIDASGELTPVEKKIAVKFIGLGILFKLETLKTVFDSA